ARPDLQDLAHKPHQGTTLGQDLGVPAASATGAAAAGGDASEPGGDPAAAPAAPGAAGAAPAASAAASTAPSSSPAAAPTATTPPAPAGALFIQVFSSRDELQASRLQTRLRAAGFKAFLSPAGAMYRVRIGPFTERADA